jgi:small subunit ribosomal protein S18
MVLETNTATPSTTSQNFNDQENKKVDQAPRKVFFKKTRGCPLALVPDKDITYKNVDLLKKYISMGGRMLPRHFTGTSLRKQRLLRKAIIRARLVGLLQFVTKYKK